MEYQLLNGEWNLKIVGRDEKLLPKEGIAAAVPGSVYGALLEAGLMEDPYYRDNELKALPLMENDFVYQTDFSVPESFLEADEILLRFDGIDTLAEIWLNEKKAGSACNMHRIWEYPVKTLLHAGENTLKVVLFSPVKYIKEENQKVYTGGSADAMEGFPHLRKAHCMFGWDWGPRLPDAGLFRKVSLVGIRQNRFDSVYITQKHADQTVQLQVEMDVQNFVRGSSCSAKLVVTAPDGREFSAQTGTFAENNGFYQLQTLEITKPMLWWPNGYGEQPLYHVRAELFSEEGELLDIWQKRIGLRTMRVNTDKDEWGNCFSHEVNGIKIFAMGADYIPEDNILGRVTPERTRRLLEDAAAVNHNSIRVWGGGYYPDDFFFDICDELGLIVWQDFMYACASYELDDAFEANITQETIDNVRRIRHHACLGLWCGNNEMETQTLDRAWKPSVKQKYDYIKIFEYIIPNILKEEDPNTFYWPSSPSSGGNYDNPWDENRGDTHYWDVWHGNKPFTEYRKYRFRYLSEFGFQSFPALKTVESFTAPGDRNIFSRVMEMHQRNQAANGKIMSYLSATYLYPKDFEHLLYASQLLQADAIRYGVEHFRRYRGRCMGAIVWQLNDIWPVASWSSIDYYGRWKALHYAEKRMYAPVMISCEEKGELSERPYCVAEPAPIEKSARLHVANETMEAVCGIVKWKLCKPNSEVVKSGEVEVCVPALDGVWLEKLDFSEYCEREIHLSYCFVVDGETVSRNTCLFTAPKHYLFDAPELLVKRDGGCITVTSKAYAKSVEIIGEDGDLKLSDNFFDMEAGEVRVQVLSGEAKKVSVRSVYDIA